MTQSQILPSLQRFGFVSFVVIYFWSDNNGVANDYYEEVNEKFFNKDYLSDEDYIYNTFIEKFSQLNIGLRNTFKDFSNLDSKKLLLIYS